MLCWKPIINSVHLKMAEIKWKNFWSSQIIACLCCWIMYWWRRDGFNCGKKVAIAKRIYNIWANEYKFPPEDLIIDVLTFSIGAGDKSLQFAAIATLDALKIIKTELPKVKTILGISNISLDSLSTLADI